MSEQSYREFFKEKQWAETKRLTLNGLAKLFKDNKSGLAPSEWIRCWKSMLEYIEKDCDKQLRFFAIRKLALYHCVRLPTVTMKKLLMGQWTPSRNF